MGVGVRNKSLRWKIKKNERWSYTPYPPVQGQGAADLMAYASAAGPLSIGAWCLALGDL